MEAIQVPASAQAQLPFREATFQKELLKERVSTLCTSRVTRQITSIFGQAPKCWR